jgi:ABC-type multidrug transport system fused ATPase/permease subunit
VGFYAAIGFCVIPAVQVSIIVGERESGCKQQQYIMGAGQLSYWVSRWLYDSAVFLPPALSTILILALAGPEGLTSPASHIQGVASLVLVYGISSCWYTYVISFLFKKAADAQLWTRLGLTLLTMGFFSAHLALALPSLLDGTTPSPSISLATHAFDYLGMLLVPPYILAVGLGDISVRAVCFPFAGPKCTPPSPFAWDILGSKIVFLLACIPVWGALVLYLERQELEGGGGFSLSTAAAAGSSVAESGEDIEDRDVREERARVMEGSSSSSSRDGVELRGLRKVYVSRGVSKVAVCDVSLKLEEGEIFGLLGPNGAGKSSLLGMLTGNVIPSGGA